MARIVVMEGVFTLGLSFGATYSRGHSLEELLLPALFQAR
jgi:hypothetical protein